MTKSSTIIFILFFAILFGLEKKVCGVNFINSLLPNKKSYQIHLTFSELAIDVDSYIDIIGTLYVYIQINPIQYARIHFLASSFDNQRYTMDICTVYYAKI